MALVRVYCGLASADESVRSASAAQLTIAVVDDAGRLLGVHEISDDPGGYAELGRVLVERTSGFTAAAVAADSDDHLVTSLLSAAGRPLVVADDDTADDFAERFADDDSIDEMQAPHAARRAVGLARAMQAGVLEPVVLSTPRELVTYKPVLAAHVALLGGRHAAATALRETLRELYPAALRAYPDPAHPLALAVLDALPEPGRLSAHGSESERVAEDVATELIRAGAGTEDELIAAVTALHVAISESPRRGGVNKSLAPAAAETVRQAISAVRACDSACASLISTLASRSTPSTAPTRRPVRQVPDPVPLPSYGRRGRTEPAATSGGPAVPHPLTTPPVAPEPLMPPPIAPRPMSPHPAAPAAFPERGTPTVDRPISAPAAAAAFPSRAGLTGDRPVSAPAAAAAFPSRAGLTGDRPVSAPAAAAAFPGRDPLSDDRPVSAPTVFPNRATSLGSRPVSAPAAGSASPIDASDFGGPGNRPVSGPGNRPVSQPPLPPGMTPITPGSRPPAARATATPPPPPASVSPADSGQPFRATLTNAAINSVRAERQRTVIPPRPQTPSRPPAAPAAPAAASGVTDYSLPMPTQRPAEPVAEPGSRPNWPLMNGTGENLSLPAASTSGSPSDGRVKPPWQDMPKEPPALRLVESQLGGGIEPTVPDLGPIGEPPSLRLIDGDDRANRRNGTRRGTAPAPAPSLSPGTSGLSPATGTTITALERSTTPPVPVDKNDVDLLIFAAARSAWFTGHSETSNDLNWANPNDTGWRAAEKAATPEVAAETPAGLPRRVPQANLVPGSPLREERPLRIVRDAASIAAHTTGYFRGWRRGQEIGGFAMGGRPGRESAGGWDFTRDGQSADEYHGTNANYGGS